MKKVVITGGTGTIGINLIDYLLKEDIRNNGNSQR